MKTRSRNIAGRPHALFVVNADWVFLDLRLPVARALRDGGWRVSVASDDTGRGEAIESEGFDFIPLALSRKGMNPVREGLAMRSMRRLMNALKPDLVHNVTIKPVVYGSLAARRAGNVPVVNSVCGLGFIFTQNPVARLARPGVKQLYRRALDHPLSRTIFENHDDRREFIEGRLVTAARSSVIPGVGVDCARFRPTPMPEGDPIVLMPARMLWSKGIADFVEAARRVRATDPRIRFVLAGEPDDGNPDAVSVAQLRAWADDGAVEWWGRSEDMPGVYAAASVVVQPTRYREGVPRVLMEAAACARPLVASDMPGCREIVRPGVNGELVPPGSADLADVLTRLLQDRDLRARYGAAGRRIAEEEFESNTVTNRFVSVHEGLLDGRASLAGTSAGLNR